jgi:hypothetical protein
MDWPKLFVTYGPYALVPFLVFVALKRAKPTPEMDAKDKTFYRIISGIVWFFIFALVAMVAIVYLKFDLPARLPPAEVAIYGTIEGLKDPEFVTSNSDPVFFRRKYQGVNHYMYEWRVITDKKLSEGKEVSFDLSDQRSQHAVYPLTIKQSFYDSPLKMQYKVTKEIPRTSPYSGIQTTVREGILVLMINGKEEPLPTEKASREIVNPPATHGLAYAQAAVSIGDIESALLSNDPIVRRNGRTALAALGRQGAPYINAVLTHKESSYRLTLGVIVALNKMNAADREAISKDAKNEIVRIAGAAGTGANLRGEQDPTMRKEAQKYVNSVGLGDASAEHAPAKKSH